MGPPLATDPLHTFAASLIGTVAAGVSTLVPYPSTSDPMGKFVTLYLLQLRFSCRVEVDGDLPHIW